MHITIEVLRMYEDLKTKTAVITGSGKRTGIGFAIADKLASCGANVVIADMGGAGSEQPGVTFGTTSEMEDIARDLSERHGVETLAVAVDITDGDSVAALAAAVKEKFGRVDVLVNNAGTAVGAPSPVLAYDEAAWLKTMDVNLHGAFRMSRAIIPLMMGKPGSVVNMASRAGKAPAAMNGAYSVSKAAVIMMTKVMAAELAPVKIRFNALCPGLIMTDLQVYRIKMEAQFFSITEDEAEKELCKRVPMGYIGEPAEVAAAAAFLASDESSYITGQSLNVCGGQIMEL